MHRVRNRGPLVTMEELNPSAINGSRRQPNVRADDTNLKVTSSPSIDFELIVMPGQMPSGFWHHVFTFVPPIFLGRLLQVNRAFNNFLSSSSFEVDRGFPLGESTQSTDVDAIWRASRKRFCPGIPDPPHGMTELQMWRLLRGRRCQYCGAADTSSTSQAGSNTLMAETNDGAQIIWSFGIRSCGVCIKRIIQKVGS